MAHYVGLEFDGDTIDLTTGDNILGQYSIRPARPLDVGMYDTVDERIRVTVNKSTPALVQAQLHEIERWLSYSVERKSAGEGAKLYLEVRPDGYTDTYRTEIYGGTFVPEPDTLELWSNAAVSGQIEITRSPFFEGPRASLRLYNRHGNSTSWLTIDNKNDATHDAFVDVEKLAVGNISGTLPAPVEIHIRNDEVGVQSWRTFYVGVNSRSDPFNLEPVIEFETQSGGGGSSSAFADASSGSYWATGTMGSGVHKYPKVTIPSTVADKFAGRFARVLIKTMTSTGEFVYQAKVLEQYGLIDLFVGRPRVGEADALVDLGVIPIPPVAYTSNLAEQKLEIECYHEELSDRSTGIDYVLLMPTDSGRTLHQAGMDIPSGDHVIFDEIEKVWVSNESDLRHPIYTPRGPGVFIIPNCENRIWILHEGGSEEYGDKSIRAYYRPRRLTL